MNRSEQMKQFWHEVRTGERPAPQRGASNGTVKRKVRCVSNWIKSSELIITIYPHGEIGFREPRHRAEYRLSMADAFRSAVVLTTNRIAIRVKALRKEGCALGKARKMATKELL